MLAVAVVFNGIQFAERIFGLNIPSSQFIAHEQQDVDSRGSATSDNARPMVAVQGDKPFVDRLATGLPAVAPDSSRPPAQATTPATPIDVAVPSTHKEAGAAQEEFAELQKKYAGILGSKQSEVQIISGQTGSWHRLVATPASTKAAASEICNDLRSAGYGRCWVKAY